MPLVKIQTSVEIDDGQKEDILKHISRCAAEITGKPETYLMVFMESGSACMAGKVGPAAFIDMRAIGGLNDSVNNRLSEQLCSVMEDRLSIPPDRVYITFTDVAAGNWGWDRKTFG